MAYLFKGRVYKSKKFPMLEKIFFYNINNGKQVGDNIVFVFGKLRIQQCGT
jgi:hypothetical protein